MHSKEITRLSRRAAELQKRVVKEKVARETMIDEISSYSNPAKLMNYLKAQKVRRNSSFRNNAEYVSHVDAYARSTALDESNQDIKVAPVNKSIMSTEQKRKKYAKLLAHKRLYDPANYVHGKGPRPTRDKSQKSQKSLRS